MLDLTPDQLDPVPRILARHLPNRRVCAFGSRVTGRAWRYSDLDLLVMGSAPIPDLTLASLRAGFEDSNLPFRVDLVEGRDLPDAWATGFPERSEAVSLHSDEVH
jgi:predicted nucleotidyltransferase